MTISEAMIAVNDEYSQEVQQAVADSRLDTIMRQVMGEEFLDIDGGLPEYVGEIGAALGLPSGTRLPDWVYQMARMCFRFGMRCQRKLDHPEVETTLYWRSGVPQ